jgi:hypothetical protein
LARPADVVGRGKVVAQLAAMPGGEALQTVYNAAIEALGAGRLVNAVRICRRGCAHKRKSGESF